MRDLVIGRFSFGQALETYFIPTLPSTYHLAPPGGKGYCDYSIAKQTAVFHKYGYLLQGKVTYIGVSVPYFYTRPKVRNTYAYFFALAVNDFWQYRPVMTSKPPNTTYLTNTTIIINKTGLLTSTGATWRPEYLNYVIIYWGSRC